MTMDDVKSYLAAVGYTATAADDWLLQFCMDKVTTLYCAETNLTAIPTSLEQNAVQNAAGEFLFAAKQSGKNIGLVFSPATKEIQVGDTKVSYDTKTSPEANYDSLVASLKKEPNFGPWRVIKW